MSALLSFSEWQERNPDLNNFVPCPVCDGFGLDDDGEKCYACFGTFEVNDLFSLYLNDIEKDLLSLKRVSNILFESLLQKLSVGE